MLVSILLVFCTDSVRFKEIPPPCYRTLFWGLKKIKSTNQSKSFYDSQKTLCRHTFNFTTSDEIGGDQFDCTLRIGACLYGSYQASPVKKKRNSIVRRHFERLLNFY